VRSVDELPELLPAADVLFVTLPLTDETRGIIGATELSLTPDQCILVNVGRGPVVEETALYEALRDGTLHAAGLDVWYTYPTDEPSRSATSPSEHPFRELANVVMSPHRAGAPNTPETEQRRMRALAELLNAAARGEEMPNRVDLELGY
jgi:phosphoglycerate dehydrogenase-like enzyme